LLGTDIEISVFSGDRFQAIFYGVEDPEVVFPRKFRIPVAGCQWLQAEERGPRHPGPLNDSSM
jgi:hypothetical protein